jgi:hypothetical protein
MKHGDKLLKKSLDEGRDCGRKARLWTKGTTLDEGHGFSRAVKSRADEGFSP